MTLAIANKPPRTVAFSVVQRARYLLANGLTLDEAAQACGVTPRDLDVSLWRALGASE